MIFGSDVVAKDVLEYVVFEKHIVNQYGIWRIHGKIIPDWMPPKESAPITNIITLEPETETALEAQPDEAKSKIVLPEA